jgi:predicted phage terminase large subunit-like protein
VGDKIEKAHAVLPMAANGKVRLVDTTLSKPWLEQLMAFPASGHDDAVDATVSALSLFIHFDDPFISEEELRSCEYDPADFE